MDTKLDLAGTGPVETPTIGDYLGLAYPMSSHCLNSVLHWRAVASFICQSRVIALTNPVGEDGWEWQVQRAIEVIDGQPQAAQ